jgi:D-psicose/D-tagatose/L-ribulose 3-epimerase
MQYGVSTFLWVSPFDTHAFDLVHKVREMGFDIIEVPVENKSLIDWPKLKDLTKSLGLKVTISGAFGMDRDISSEDPGIRKNGLQYIEDCVEIASFMESPLFGGPLYSAVGKTIFISE